jgi:broad specificity phosphatase PhoE
VRLMLIRHGQTPANVLHQLDSTVPGPGLTILGAEQAEAIPRALDGEPIDAIYASTMTRAQLTAAPLAASRGLPVLVRDGLREIFAGDLETRTDHEAATAYVRTTLAWADGDLSRRMPGGEDGAEVLARFDEVVAEVAGTSAGAAVVVSHGAIIRTWAAARAENLDAAFAAENALSNTGIVVLDGDPSTGWRALTWAGDAIGGPALSDLGDDGPAGEPVDGTEVDYLGL